MKDEFNFRSKLPFTKTSIFAVMTKMSNEYNAINLSQGFPDFDVPEELRNLVNENIAKGRNQYAPMPGIPELRENISKKIRKDYKRYYDPETEITITAGATQALYTAITALIDKGDEAIIPEPAYDSYVPAVVANGGVPVFITMKSSDYKIDWEKIRRYANNRTRLIILNSPHNPTGSVITEEDIKNLEDIVSNSGIFVVSDEVYEHIVFDGRKHLSLASSEILSERSFVISSFGKTFHATGWKMGYCAAPKALTDEFRKIHQFVVFSVNTPIQYAYAEFLKNEKHYKSLGEFYSSKRDVFLNAIRDSRFKWKPTEGTYFQLLDYSDISEDDDMSFASFLTKEKGVAAIPLSPFYSRGNDEKLIRICFAKRNEVLARAGKILSIL